MSVLKKLDALLAGKPLSRALARELLAEHRDEVLRDAAEKIRWGVTVQNGSEEELRGRAADLIDPDKD